MDFKKIAVSLFIVLNMQIEYACCAVVWNMTTVPAIFGKDIILTCYTFYPLKKSKDCSVRQWSGGIDGRGLIYNGLSSNKQKYKEQADLLSSQFSLIIQNLSTTDINVNYTCSCGFFAYTNKLQIDEQRFQSNHNKSGICWCHLDTHRGSVNLKCISVVKLEVIVFKDHVIDTDSPDNTNALISTDNETLKIKMQMTKVYPLPTCSVHIGGRVVSNKVWLTYRKRGLFYSVSFVGKYKLVEEDCDKKPRVQCDLLKDQILFEGNITHTCPDLRKFQSYNEDRAVGLCNDNGQNRAGSSNTVNCARIRTTSPSSSLCQQGFNTEEYMLYKVKPSVIKKKKKTTLQSGLLKLSKLRKKIESFVANISTTYVRKYSNFEYPKTFHNDNQ